MNIDEHFKLLINKYDLHSLHYQFIGLSIFTTIIKESFYWLLLLFSELVKKNEKLIRTFSITLILLLGFNLPLERTFNRIKSEFIKQIKLANDKFFNDKIINMDKDELLNFDLVQYYNILDGFNKNMEDYIINIKNKHDIPIRMITLIIIALNKNFNLLIILFIIFYLIVRVLNENKIITEKTLLNDFFKYDNYIRNYIINAKNLLINNDFNKEYINKNYEEYERLNKDILELNNSLDYKVNIVMFIFIMIVIVVRLKELNQYDFFYYFLIIYDIEFIADKVNEYYKNKVNYTKMEERLKYLYELKTEMIENIDNLEPVEEIKINKILNKAPRLVLTKPIIFKKGKQYLINGESGSGKTSLLYSLKGIVKPEVLEITPNIDIIKQQTFISLPNNKGLYNGYLYDIISNYENEPDIELIKETLSLAKIDKFNNNELIDIEKQSSGEKMRLTIAKIIYTIKRKNYNILLFDEIDSNLNDELALEICNNLISIFNDKIILYISHNEKVKKLFNNKIIVKNGFIYNSD